MILTYRLAFALCLTFGFSPSFGQLQLNHYYGNLHAHTGYSDGSVDSVASGVSTPFQAYNFAKASLHFDFLGISEHNHQTAGMLRPNYHRGLAQADSANDDGSFVALFGMEWGTISTGGHVLIYGCNELLGWESGNHDEFVAKGDYNTIWQKINARPGAFATCAHPQTGDYNALIGNPLRPEADQALVGSAFRSGPAFSTNISYSNQSSSSYESYYRQLLMRGYHVAPTYDHDNHYTTFGRHTEGRLVVLAPSLTRENIMTALRNRNFYASDDWNAEANLTFDNQYPMGSKVYQTSQGTIQLTVTDGDGENVASMILMRGVPGSGNQPLVVASTPAGISALTYTDTLLAAGEGAYYYAVITQVDSDRILTAPIWHYRFPEPVPSSAPDQLAQAAELLVWPNPVQSASCTPLSVTTTQPGRVMLLDALGRTLRETNAGQNGTLLPTDGIEPGLYFVVYLPDGQHAPVTRRVVVQ